ncbi:unnamed protein product [Phytophthora fragariaefolia]|uniref:Unnamed protein product n=1 Tax=Phytophthora fragariaefolia TaxID=1490495 RepID=A0A9W6XWL3_9STRA|nr:unnamed protein product [Phytophthora fragariaefolia]
MDDWKLAKRILRYLAGTREFRLCMQEDGELDGPLRVVAYSDADFAADREDRKSVTGGLAEFTAASVIGQELLGIRELVNELGVSLVMLMSLRVDNQAALKQLSGEQASSKAEPIDTRIKFVVHIARAGTLMSEYCEGKSMPANMLTKAVPAARLCELRQIVGLT